MTAPDREQIPTSQDLEWREVPSDPPGTRRWILFVAGTQTPYDGDTEVADDEL